MVKVHHAQIVDRSHSTDEKTSHCKSRAFSSKTPTENGGVINCSKTGSSLLAVGFKLSNSILTS